MITSHYNHYWLLNIQYSVLFTIIINTDPIYPINRSDLPTHYYTILYHNHYWRSIIIVICDD